MTTTNTNIHRAPTGSDSDKTDSDKSAAGASSATSSATVGVVGLGYVGLPLLLAFHNAGFKTVGFYATLPLAVLLVLLVLRPVLNDAKNWIDPH